MSTEIELDPFDDYRELRIKIALEVAKLVSELANKALFHRYLKSFYDKSIKHYQQEIDQSNRDWEAAMVDPNLRDKNAGPPSKEYEWKDHDPTRSHSFPPTKDEIKELRKKGFKGSWKDVEQAYKENRWGYWRRKFDRTQHDPFMWFIPDGTLKLEHTQNRAEELESHFVLLAVLHDNEIEGCVRIDEGKWEDELSERIYKLLLGFYGDKSTLLKRALEDVIYCCEAKEVQPAKAERQIQPEGSSAVTEQGKSKRQDLNDCITHVAQEVDNLIIGNDEVEKRFTTHVQKVLTEVEKYGEYIRVEYNKAKEKGYTKHDEKPEGEDWNWYSAFNKGTIYHFGGEMVTFWMKEKPKTNPMSFVNSMAVGCIGKLHENLTLLDYQYFFLTCVHDAQRWVAGQECIYFEPLDKNDLKNKICQKIWETVTRDISNSSTLADILTTIQTAFQAVSRDIQSDKKKPAGAEWSTKATIIVSLCTVFIFLSLVYLLPINWLKNHPNSYGLQGGIIFMILSLVVGWIKPQWRKWCWGTACLAFFLLILSLLGGRTSQ